MKPFKLEDIEKKEQPFIVPEGYFEALPMQVQGRVSAKESNSWARTPAFKLALSMATMLAIVVAGLFFFAQSDSPEELLADISHEELLAYFDLVEVEESDILAALGVGGDDIDFFGTEGLEEIEIEDGALDELLLEYELSEEYL